MSWYLIAISKPEDKGTGKQPQWIFDGKATKQAIESIVNVLKYQYPGKVCEIYKGKTLGLLEKEVLL